MPRRSAPGTGTWLTEACRAHRRSAMVCECHWDGIAPRGRPWDAPGAGRPSHRPGSSGRSSLPVEACPATPGSMLHVERASSERTDRAIPRPGARERHLGGGRLEVVAALIDRPAIPVMPGQTVHPDPRSVGWAPIRRDGRDRRRQRSTRPPPATPNPRRGGRAESPKRPTTIRWTRPALVLERCAGRRRETVRARRRCGATGASCAPWAPALTDTSAGLRGDGGAGRPHDLARPQSGLAPGWTGRSSAQAESAGPGSLHNRASGASSTQSGG